ncbi:winged helix-turn-helix transcriptional regulator [Pseudonocardia sp. CA-107938]|uniref:winged helix-turn-helix transcriptional regulator n=1 Tax=Pseudonocardia sp. CA-107938 TaxID=3240021 RepID=UPI003D8E3FCB
MTRSYGHYCGLARALDVIGDRWNLLIVRELLVAPARYRELLDGLPGVATNLLAARLRDLEAAGVVERRLADEGNSVRYALTPWGAALREPVEGLIRWSAPLMVRGPEGDAFDPDWLVLALPALFAGRTVARSAAVGVSVDGAAVIQIKATSAGVTAGRHDGSALDAVVHADPATVLGLAAGVLPVDDALRVDGDRAAVQALFSA